MSADEKEKRRESFEEAFSSGVHGCRRHCDCGREFYHPDAGAWTWEDGELESLNADPNATALEWAVGLIEIDGRLFVPADNLLYVPGPPRLRGESLDDLLATVDRWVAERMAPVRAAQGARACPCCGRGLPRGRTPVLAGRFAAR